MIKKFFLNLAERFLGRYQEGVLPPGRFFDQVETFDKMNAHATRREWALFASNLMAEAYRDAYIRGREYTDRDRDEWFPNPRPEVIANYIMPGWDEPLNRAMLVPDIPITQETETQKVMRQIRELNR